MHRVNTPRASPLLRRVLLPAATGLLIATPASATWSVIAVDQRTGQVVIASATCVAQERFAGFPAEGLMDIQAIVLPGIGVAAAQAGVDATRENQQLIYREMTKGTAPEDILDLLREDPSIERRQFGIVDLQGRCAGFSGDDNGAASLSAQGQVSGTGIFYSVQGNILASDEVVHLAVAAFEAENGTLADRVMAAMEAADRAGGDRRCTCASEPVLPGVCEYKTSHVAYLLVADSSDPSGDSYNNGEYALYLDVTDQNIEDGEDPNPVRTLAARYAEWKRRSGS